MPFWTQLRRDQLGTYAEYLFRLTFAKSGMDIYLPEIDDKGIDFVVRTKAGFFFEIQCKARRQLNYSYIEKSKFVISPARYLALALFLDEHNDEPEMFLIPSTVWQTPTALFVDRRYEGEGQTSAPEWGLQFSQKNMVLLNPYRIQKLIKVGDQTLEPYLSEPEVLHEN